MYISLLVIHHLVSEGATPPRQERRNQTEDPRHSLYSRELLSERLKSGNNFVHSVTPLYTNPPAERLRAWTHHLRSVSQKLKSIPSEDQGPGSEAPWLHGKCLNRLRTGMGSCKSNMIKWKYSDADTICDCDMIDYRPTICKSVLC